MALESTEKAQSVETDFGMLEATENLNILLCEESFEWDNRTIINALVRSYAGRCCAGNMEKAWKKFSNVLREKMHINLGARMKVREANGGKEPHKSLAYYLVDEETGEAAKIAMKICEDAGLHTSAIINEVNFKNLTDRE